MRFLECLKSAGKILHGNNYLWSMMKKSSVSRMQIFMSPLDPLPLDHPPLDPLHWTPKISLCGGRGKTRAKFLDPHLSGPPPFGPSTGPPPVSGPTLLRGSTLCSPKIQHPKIGQSRHWPKSKLAEVQLGVCSFIVQPGSIFDCPQSSQVSSPANMMPVCGVACVNFSTSIRPQSMTQLKQQLLAVCGS